MGADALLLAAAVLWRRSRARRAAHSVFVPVVIGRSIYRHLARRAPRRRLGLLPLLRSARQLFVGRPAALSVVLALMVVAPLATLLPGREPAGMAPEPRGEGSRPIGWASLERLWLQGRSDELPSVADYVAHEAYQSSLGYGLGYRLPSRLEAVSVRSFAASSDGPGIVAGERTVFRFDDRWLRAALAGARPGSVGALLVSQRRAVRVGLAREAPAAPGPDLVRVCLSFVLAALSLAVGSRYLGAPGGKPLLERRRPEEA